MCVRNAHVRFCVHAYVCVGVYMCVHVYVCVCVLVTWGGNVLLSSRIGQHLISHVSGFFNHSDKLILTDMCV